MSYLDKLKPVEGKSTKTTTTEKGKGYLSKLQPVEENSLPQKKEGGGVKEFVKSIVSAPLTIAARPIQAVAELVGAKSENVDKVSSKLSGGLIAPVPQSGADVKKDVGRGMQTVALGLGPVSGGAAFGAGYSVEQGNNVFSKETALNAGIGAVGGKLLDLVGKPLLDVTGKVVGKITPQIIKDVSNQGSKAVEEFASRHKILPEGASTIVNKGAEGLERGLNKPFEVAGNIAKKPFVKTPENIINGREKELAKIDSDYAGMRKATAFSKDEGIASRRRVAETDVLSGSVDDNGLIRTKGKGGAIEQYKAQTVDQAEGVVRKNLEARKEMVSLKTVEKELTRVINESGLQGKNLTTALNDVKKEIAGYKLRANKKGEVPLTLIHDAKVDNYNSINYLTAPEVKTGRKTIARGLKEIIENNSKFNVKEVNAELAKYLEDIKLLERLDGKRVKGGKLGKYFAQISGNLVGGAVGGAVGGPLGMGIGTVAGGELANRIKGSMLERTLGGKTGYVAPKNKVLEEAMQRLKGKGEIPFKLGEPEKAFLKSKNQEQIGNFVLGDYGRNSIQRKTIDGLQDRLPINKLGETINNIKNTYKAGNTSFRKDNLVHVAKMPNGETRAVVTRVNPDGKEEIISFFKIGKDVNTFIKNLESFGTPDRSRTDILSLERSGSSH